MGRKMNEFPLKQWAIFKDVSWLKGIKVVEVTTGASAPLAGRILAELGAEVVKVESGAKIDVNRARVRRPTDPADYPNGEAFQLLHETNAGKKSVTLNLKTEEGKKLFKMLLSDSDVFIENFVPGWLDRLDMSISTLREEFPELVILSASGYGQNGPLSTQRAYAPVMTSLAGVEGLIGYQDGEVMGCSALALADLNCSFMAVFLIMSGLIGRKDTGCGMHIDLSQIEASVSMIGEAFVEEQLSLNSTGPRGNVGPNGEEWSLTRAEGNDVWVASTSALSEERNDIVDEKSRPSREELLAVLRNKGAEAVPVLTPDEVAADERFNKSGFTQQVTHPHPLVGQLDITSVPWKIDYVIPRVLGAAPLLGNANDEILGRYLSKEELETYELEGVLK
ncbi:CaiB/BaiF CoA transferase family protein [Bacillus sp. 1P02SD]|uniref:CaiB/BaiF CoA transferase family protein n=1 Tax=Bacillus sp. 1P02SD TaxID=3132264 RepID=UPI0039A3735D